MDITQVIIIVTATSLVTGCIICYFCKKSRVQSNSAEEYTHFVRKFVSLLDQQLSVWEERAKKKDEIHDLARSMPAFISFVNTIGYLRGQDGMFLDIRPRTENQKEFYGYEDSFEKRLEKLIDIILNSAEKQFYQERLDSYFVKIRTKQKPTVF